MLTETKQLIYCLLDNKIDKITDETINFLLCNETTDNLLKVQNALKLNKSVECIKLKKYCIHYYNVLLEGLKFNNCVKLLKLYYDSFEDIKILSMIILQNSSITNVKLKYINKCNFSSKQINYTILKEALITNKTIKKVKLTNNNNKIKNKQFTTEYIYNNIHQNISILLISTLNSNISKVSLKKFFINFNILLKVLKANKLDKLKLYNCIIYNNMEDYNTMLLIKSHKKIIYNKKYDIPLKEITYYADYINYLIHKYEDVKVNIEKQLKSLKDKE